MFQPTTYTRLLMRAAPLLNVPVAAIVSSPLLGGMLRRNIALITYTGRRSGRGFNIPVAYRQRGKFGRCENVVAELSRRECPDDAAHRRSGARWTCRRASRRDGTGDGR